MKKHKNDRRRIVEKKDNHIVTDKYIVIELLTATQLFRDHDTAEIVFGKKVGDGACIFKLFVDRGQLDAARLQYAETKVEGLTVRIEVTLI